MSTARKKGEQPDFLVDEVWEKLKETWSDPKYKALCEQNKKNRLSDKDGMGSSKHTGVLCLSPLGLENT